MCHMIVTCFNISSVLTGNWKRGNECVIESNCGVNRAN